MKSIVSVNPGHPAAAGLSSSVDGTAEDSSFSSDALPPLPEVLAGRVVLTPTGVSIRSSARCYSSSVVMDSLHNSDRPISYGSTSSSASSRDSHCSLSGRPVLGPALERDAGAIRLELVPARQLDCADQDKETAEPVDTNTAQTPQGVKVAYVDRVVQEILDTERTYVEDLRSIVQDYLDCIIDQSSLLLGEEDRSSLFGNIRDIYCFNSALLRDLQKCNADPAAIAECFVAKSEDFHIYTQYCTNYPRSVAMLSDCMRNKSVVKFLRERQESLKHLLPLGSYLLKPVQRILKYHLLLHEIANHLPKDTEMYDVVLEAIDTMQRVAWHINDMKRKHEHAIRLQEIQSLLTNWKGPDLIGYGELVLEGTFRIQRAKSERTFFLFDKLLLITKKRDETFTYKAHILCCNLMLVELIPKEPLSFSVFHYKNPKLQHTVQAKSQQDKRSWILHLKRLILENHPAKIPAKAKQAILEMDAANHPGFHYSPDENNKSSSHAKEGPSPRRVRRKSEPLSKLLKNSKHSVASPDVQKRSSLGATLLSPVMHLGSIGRSRSLVSQSEDSLDPGDHGDLSDREEGSQQQDADDEDDSGPGSGKRLKVPGKGSRKRLNPQVSVDNIDRWREHGHTDLQTAKETLQMDSGHTPILRVTHPLQGEGDTHVTVPNIWADHKVRRAMFPTRQLTTQIDDEEDIYQMFVPTEPVGTEQESDRESNESSGHPGRPCSWHVEQTRMLQLDHHAVVGSKVLRRASSVDPATAMPTHREPESSSNEISGSSSAEQLTLDDVENVYDNISLEELQAMGLVRRESDVNRPVSSEDPGLSQSSTGTSHSSANERSAPDACDLQIVEEENIYDTITFIVPPLPSLSKEVRTERGQTGFMPDTGPATSKESLLQLEEDGKGDCSHPKKTSPPAIMKSGSEKTESTSEKVDEIWNDLENYIRKNERKADKLPAAFPVAGHETTSVVSPRKKQNSKANTSKGNSVSKSKMTTHPPSQPPPARAASPPLTFRIPKLKVPQLSREPSFEVDDPLCVSFPPSPAPVPTTPQNPVPSQPLPSSPPAVQTLPTKPPVPLTPSSKQSQSQSLPPKTTPPQTHSQKTIQSKPLPSQHSPSQTVSPKQAPPPKTAPFQPLPAKPIQSQPLPEQPVCPKPNQSQTHSPKAQALPLKPVQSQPLPPKLSSPQPLSPNPIQSHSLPPKPSPCQSLPPKPTPSCSISSEAMTGPQLVPSKTNQSLPPIPSIQVSPAIPEPPPVGTVKSIRNKLARLSSGSFRMDDDYDEDLESPRDPPPPIHREELQTLFPGLDASLFPFLSEAGDQFLDLGDKSRNRVFLMARQYSQKIKKANQLMKMKSMDVEPSCARNTRSKSKDLADILEEKKQGGAAIGARIAEYSQLYDHVIFKDSQKTTPKGPGGRPSPGLASSPSLPECSMLDDDWLNSIYSNGQLASTPSSAAEESDQRPQRRLASTTSVPSFQNLLQSPLAQPSQRWSACVTTPTTEDPDHIYSSLGPSSSSPKISPYGRCQSSSSLADQLEKENGGGNCRWDGPKCHTAMSPGKSGCGLGARQSSLPEYPSHFSLSPDPDLTLRDSQQVLLLDRKLPLGTLVATRNYLANFKDNGEDDDYVEIRSEEESKQEQCRTAGDGTRLVQTQSLPCSPARSCHGAAGSVGGRSQLKDYVWQDLEDTSQPNIVQSLREKFRCLSSSSFA
ncbi:pleckstrin homology domain-containing family G member 1-like [Denticeps clupeoides]|uniref:pleckstrin homology domain-containing family G member 1-like n=1 Tax=Denticeps clupeoides TaxID=299321 RepID=UPI0010A511FB|nr:pleckstrin homology domain-containing family G member 1-like [Denticeps clupeoides]